MRNVIIFGSTGSIGKNTLDVMEKYPDKFNVTGLASNRNWKLLLKQINKFNPDSVYVENNQSYEKLKKQISSKIKIFTYNKFKDDKISHFNYHLNRIKSIENFFNNTEFDITVNSTVGLSGLIPSIQTINRKKDLLLANKESLVTAGSIINKLIKKNKSLIIPIDSEHSAIFHILKGIDHKDIKRIIITASGGPFFKNNIKNPDIKQVLAHPTWKMGKKITVDSATMMNKAFEIIEAHHLFDLPFDKIDAVIHPESIIHSMVETIDGEIYAQLGRTDMKHPIQNALTYPELYSNKYQHLDLFKINSLSFHKIDKKKYPVFYLALKAGISGGIYPAILNSANDILVNYFLESKIKYIDIYTLLKKILNKFPYSKISNIEDIFLIDEKVKIYINNILK